MDFLRFTGEWIVYYALIALAGGCAGALMIGVLTLVGRRYADRDHLGGPVGRWQEPFWWPHGWSKRKKSVIENIAPVLTADLHPDVRRHAAGHHR